VETYRHSGRSGFAGVPITAVVGGVTAVGLGVAYAFSLTYIPVVQASVLATVGLGFGMGASVGWASKVGKIRNNLIAGSLGLVFGLLALYIAWVVDPLARFGSEGFLAWDPIVLIEYMKWGLENGFWGIGHGDAAVTGLALGITWLVEAMFVVGCSAVVAFKFTSDQTFCEACDQWTKTTKGIAHLTAPVGGSLSLTQLKQGQLSALADFDRSAGDDYPHLRLDLSICPLCNEANYLTIQQVEMGQDGNGNPQEKEKPVLRNLYIEADGVPALYTAGRPVEADVATETPEPMALPESMSGDREDGVPVLQGVE
jgi:hypothetical protein